jgi:small subunit ribosomal protein S19
MSRAKWKGYFFDSSVFSNKKSIKVWSRKSSIPFYLLNQYVLVHNGKEFKKIFITREKIGFKFGEFAFTRKYTSKFKNTKSNIKQQK